jgi:hypothetical protein
MTAASDKTKTTYSLKSMADELLMFAVNLANQDDENEEWEGRDNFRNNREAARKLADKYGKELP